MDVSELCNLCKRQNDQMLMLSCIHDPCINCAASTFAEQVHIKGQNSEIYICEICGEETALDSSTIAELKTLSKSYVRMPTSIKAASHSINTRTSHQTTAKRHKQSVSPNSKRIIYYCKDHSEEQISYYCFSCFLNICPQCAIHGGHKDHNVKLIKKAIGEVKGEYLQIMSKIGTNQNNMTRNKDNFLKSIKESNERYGREKSFISKQFEQLRNSLLVKEREILKVLDEINKENIQTLTGFLEEINHHYEDITKTKKSIELILRKDEVLIFQDYKKISEIQERVDNVRKVSEEINGEVLVLNIEYMQQEVRKIDGLLHAIKENIKKQPVLSITRISDHSLQI